MIRIIIFGVMVLVGGGVGVGAGIFLRPAPEVAEEEPANGEHKEAKTEDHGDKEAQADESHKDETQKEDGYADDGHSDDGYGEDDPNATEIAKLSNQFIVPILDDKRVTAMVVLTLSLETKPGGQQLAFDREPKIRDAFLQVLFDHANAGGFSENFTSGDRLDRLRELLRAASKPVLKDYVVNVLVTNIARQDM